MRKAAFLVLALLFLAGGGMGMAFAAILPARDQVELTETMRYGDRAAAEGVTVRTRTTFRNHLFWDTACTPGEGLTVDTNYEFSPSERREYRERTPAGIELSTGSYHAIDLQSENPTGFSAVLQELAASAPPGEQVFRTVYLKDYYNYYPLDISLDIPGIPGRLWDGDFQTDVTDPEPDTEEYIIAAFRDFFRIPVLEDEQVTLSYQSGDGGTSYGYGPAEDSDHFSGWSTSVLTGEACYFTFDHRTWNDAVVDTSLIPGGYGVYRLPRSDGEFGVDVDGLELVYSLEPSHELLNLTLSPDQSKLLIHQRVESTYVLTVVELATMATLQRLEGLDWAGDNGGGWFLYEGEDFLTVVLDYEKLAVLSLTGEGLYAFQFSARIAPESAEGADSLVSLFHRAVMDFDGQRLAASGLLDHYESTDFWLAVYDSSGLLCYGEYASSLTPGGGGDYSSICRPMDYDSISVSLS